MKAAAPEGGKVPLAEPGVSESLDDPEVSIFPTESQMEVDQASVLTGKGMSC